MLMSVKTCSRNADRSQRQDFIPVMEEPRTERKLSTTQRVEEKQTNSDSPQVIVFARMFYCRISKKKNKSLNRGRDSLRKNEKANMGHNLNETNPIRCWSTG